MRRKKYPKQRKNIVNELKSMEVSWTNEQKMCWKDKVEESVMRNSQKSHYKDLLLIQCKKHGGPLTSTEDVHDLVSKTSDKKKLKSYLGSEVRLQKALHPFDAKERSYLYKINILTAEELTENLIILQRCL